MIENLHQVRSIVDTLAAVFASLEEEDIILYISVAEL